MIQPYPPSPRPVFTRICCTFMINFSTLYISYIFQLKFKLSWPLCIFLTHKNTKSHIIKTHNCCESIKRELKQKKQFLEVHWQMYCTSVFFFLFFFNFTTRWWVHRVPSSIECVGWLDGSKAEAQPDKVYKINPPSSCVLFKGEKMWGRKNKPKKKKSHRKKKKYCSSWNPFFSAGFFFFFFEKLGGMLLNLSCGWFSKLLRTRACSFIGVCFWFFYIYMFDYASTKRRNMWKSNTWL